jgi:uncharacterized protein DUF6328
MDLSRKVKIALGETRILILGSQILMGFEFQSVFSQAFDKFPSMLQHMDGLALVMMMIVIALLIAPTIHHRVVEGGEDTPQIHSFITGMASMALLPLAFSLGLDVYIGITWALGLWTGVIAGIAFAGLALFWWYGFEMFRRRTIGHEERAMKHQGRSKSSLSTRIEQMLTEARVILPGAQALLGFQLAVIMTDTFENLPPTSKLVHSIALGLVALTIVLLMAPAAYHRIVYRGEEAQEFEETGSMFITAATIPLALGLSADIYVAIVKIVKSDIFAIAVASVTLIGFIGLWHVYPLILRERKRNP